MPIVKQAHMFIMMAQDKLFEETVEFYNKLGMPTKFHLKEKWAEFHLPNILVGLCPTEEELPDRRTGIVLEVENLKKLYEEKKDFITFLAEPFEAVHGIMVSIKDPSGNVLDFYQPTPDKVKDLAKKIKDAEEAGHKNPCECTECDDCNDCCSCQDCDEPEDKCCGCEHQDCDRND